MDQQPGSVVAVTEAVETGDVLVINPEQPGLMRRSSAAEDHRVFGIVADRVSSEVEKSPAALQAPVVLYGIAMCKVDASYGSIQVGDLLTTSWTPGHAMRVDNARTGALLGKALEPLDSGTGMIKVLVTLR